MEEDMLHAISLSCVTFVVLCCHCMSLLRQQQQKILAGFMKFWWGHPAACKERGTLIKSKNNFYTTVTIHCIMLL